VGIITGFKELKILDNYSSDKDDILNDFYIPALSESINYKRIAGFFSSKSLAIAAKGIKKFIKNNGKMQLLIGALLNADDVKAIMDGLKKPEEILEQIGINELESIDDAIVKNHVKALAWMIANGNLEIKIAIVLDDKHNPLDADSAIRCGIFHQKVGILTDKEGDELSFSGSLNETAKAWKDNFEEFKVFKSWVDSDKSRFQSDLEKFSRFWNGQIKRLRVISIPEAFEERLIHFAPKNIEDLDFEWSVFERGSPYTSSSSDDINPIIETDLKKLRWYQKEALQRWFENSNRGILEMATGSGKTYVGIMGSYQLFKKNGKLFIIILVPSKQLVVQWGQNISKYSSNIIQVSSSISKKRWRDLLDSYLFLFNNNSKKFVFLISTIQSFYSNVFPLLKEKIDFEDALLIIDEAHWIGAEKTRVAFSGMYFPFTLGLTATPIRYFDDFGTRFLYDFIGPTIFTFSILQGQKEGFLCKYYYHIIFADLSDDELLQYKRYSKLIAIYSGKDEEKTIRYLNKRAKVIKDAKSKFRYLEIFLNNYLKNNEINNCVIYADENQIPFIKPLLKKHDIIFGEFLGTTPDEERDLLISKLESGMIQAIIAIKCLNEGIDIKPLKLGIFLSSSGNPREFIQRRGRLLRTFKGKGIVEIYDLVIAPDPRLMDFSNEERIMHDKILRKELNRVKDFNEAALNSYENERIILEKLDMLIG